MHKNFGAVPVAETQIRGKKQAISQIYKKAVDGIDDTKDKIVVYGCGDNVDDLKILKEKILDNGYVNIYEVKVGPTMTAHTGPAIIGIAIL